MFAAWESRVWAYSPLPFSHPCLSASVTTTAMIRKPMSGPQLRPQHGLELVRRRLQEVVQVPEDAAVDSGRDDREAEGDPQRRVRGRTEDRDDDEQQQKEAAQRHDHLAGRPDETLDAVD